jgi:hypothetical protein
MKIRLELKWADTWVGKYHKIKTKVIDNTPLNCLRPKLTIRELHVWICIIPCLPIHLWWELKD